MATEVWFRNVHRFPDVLVENGARNLVWHQGMLIKRRIDPVAFARVSFPAGWDWRALVVGAYGATEYDHTSRSEGSPRAVYPTWHYGDESWDRLVALCESDVPGQPWNGSEHFYRPRKGQERRILIIHWPSPRSNEGKRFLGMLGDLQLEYPDTILHLFEARYFRTAFSYGLRAVDLDPHSESRFKKLLLPNGKQVHVEKATAVAPMLSLEHHPWVQMLGFSVSDLRDPVKRLSYNIRSCMWAGEHYGESDVFRVRPARVDKPLTQPYGNRARPRLGDKVACDHCSLFNQCKLARVGGVCTLPGTETENLASYFRTRDAEKIMEGMGELLAKQAERVEMASEWERQNGELDPELTKIVKAMVDGAAKLAKLADPRLAAAGSPKLAIQINQGDTTTQIAAANPAQLMSSIVRELEASGIPRDQITPEMILRAVGGASTPDAIEVTSSGG